MCWQPILALFEIRSDILSTWPLLLQVYNNHQFYLFHLGKFLLICLLFYILNLEAQTQIRHQQNQIGQLVILKYPKLLNRLLTN